jgi:hypothetical protein
MTCGSFDKHSGECAKDKTTTAQDDIVGLLKKKSTQASAYGAYPNDHHRYETSRVNAAQNPIGNKQSSD